MAAEDSRPDRREEPTLDQDGREEEIGRILNEFLDARARGEPVSERKLYALSAVC